MRIRTPLLCSRNEHPCVWGSIPATVRTQPNAQTASGRARHGHCRIDHEDLIKPSHHSPAREFDSPARSLRTPYASVSSPTKPRSRQPKRPSTSSRRLSTLVYHSAHSISNNPSNNRRIFPADRLPSAGRQSTPGLEPYSHVINHLGYSKGGGL